MVIQLLKGAYDLIRILRRKMSGLLLGVIWQ